MKKKTADIDALKTVVVSEKTPSSPSKVGKSKGGSMKKLGGCFTGLLKLILTLVCVIMGISVAFTYFSALQTDFEWAGNFALVVGVFALVGSFLALAQKKRIKKYMLAIFAALFFVSGLVPYLATHPEQNELVQSYFDKARSSVEDAIESFTKPSVEITRDEDEPTQVPVVIPVSNPEVTTSNSQNFGSGLNLEGVSIESALDLGGLEIESAK